MSKKKGKKSKKHDAEPLIYETLDGDVISVNMAFSQAIVLLDIAAITAVSSGDTDGMATVANNWMQLAALLGGTAKSEEEDSSEGDVVSTTKILGFRDRLSREAAEDDARKSEG